MALQNPPTAPEIHHYYAFVCIYLRHRGIRRAHVGGYYRRRWWCPNSPCCFSGAVINIKLLNCKRELGVIIQSAFEKWLVWEEVTESVRGRIIMRLRWWKDIMLVLRSSGWWGSCHSLFQKNVVSMKHTKPFLNISGICDHRNIVIM